MRWKLRSPEDLKVARFDDEALVFNPVSWQTHLLNESAVRVLEALRAGPRSVDEVAAALQDTAPTDSDLSAAREMGEALLADLKSLGLVSEDDSAVPCD